MTRMVAGFLFSRDLERVALVQKRHGPAVLHGKWNAIGGKIESDETPHDAMVREFREETGVTIPEWTLFLVLQGNGWQVHFFHAVSEKIVLVKQREDEPIKIWDVFTILRPLYTPVPNLRWIIPMALGHTDDHVAVYNVQEAVTCQ